MILGCCVRVPPQTVAVEKVGNKAVRKSGGGLGNE